MDNKKIITIVYLFVLLSVGTLSFHHAYLSGRSELMLLIASRLVVACAVIVGLGTKRFGMKPRECAAIQFAVVVMSLMADHTVMLLAVSWWAL